MVAFVEENSDQQQLAVREKKSKDYFDSSLVSAWTNDRQRDLLRSFT